VTASTTTTIRGVSIFSRQRKHKADVFDIALSPEGIAIRRPGRSEQRMAWERISQWELEERPGCIVLTLRGGGSVTPLAVKGWSLDDLETVMRDATERAPGPADRDDRDDRDEEPTPVPATPEALAAREVAAPRPEPQPEYQPEPHQEHQPEHQPVSEPAQPRAARRQAARRPRRSIGKTLVTVVLLGVVAAAVVVVLLQSAGVISWSFLGPVA
jgi:hypothetical protein